MKDAPVVQLAEATELNPVKWWFESTQAHQFEKGFLMNQQTETPAEKSRREYPKTAAMVDELRNVFGPGVKVKSTSEKPQK